MKKSNTKEKIIDSAAFLFHTQGYDGTSVREIAKKANVNPANIAYYFSNKAGLLEYLVSTFLEGYISVIEDAYHELETRSARECLLLFLKNMMNYQKDNRHLARLVHREITLDTILIREIMTTYLMKEKFYLKSILEKGMNRGEFRKLPIPYTILQVKGMLSMPYLHPQYMSEVLHVMPNEPYFTEMYSKELEKWVNYTVCLSSDESVLNKRPVPLMS